MTLVCFFHKGGLHQNTFPPQLSLVTGNTPTLTINNFSSPNSNGVAPTTNVLLQEYQSPIGVTASATGCAVTVNGSSCLTNTSSATGNMVVHGGGGNQPTANQTAVQATTKKREAFLPSQGQPVKLENKSSRTSCLCRNSNGTTTSVLPVFSAKSINRARTSDLRYTKYLQDDSLDEFSGSLDVPWNI